ncbi:uncharacterized protein LOC104006775 [Pan troglodytes]|uniref:uncharacterized protein LOC104006775 n=1 Tax=Pan troglodytes TaxID=9598 RepID=UPI003013EF13
MYFKSSDELCDLLDPEDTVKSKSFDLLEKLLPEKQVPIPTPKEYSWILHRKELKVFSIVDLTAMNILGHCLLLSEISSRQTHVTASAWGRSGKGREAAWSPHSVSGSALGLADLVSFQ